MTHLFPSRDVNVTVTMTKVQPQPVSSEDYSQSLQFFESLLRVDSECRLEQEYPLAFQAQRPEHIYVVRQDGTFQAGLVTLERQLEIGDGLFANALFIGSVVTAPEYRQKGMQRILFDKVDQIARDREIDLLVLWSSQLEFYEKLGFGLGGLQATWGPLKSQSLVDDCRDVQVGPSTQIKFQDEWYKSFSQKRYKVMRTSEEMKRLWNIPQMRAATTKNAYALLGKGEDFHHIIHEWAGPDDEVLRCFEALRREDPKAQILSPGVVHTEDEVRVVEVLERHQFEARLEYLGLFRIVSDRLKFECLDPHALKYPFFIWGLDSI